MQHQSASCVSAAVPDAGHSKLLTGIWQPRNLGDMGYEVNGLELAAWLC